MKLRDLLVESVHLETLSRASADLSMLVKYAFDSIDQGMVGSKIKTIKSLSGKTGDTNLEALIKKLPSEITMENTQEFRKIAGQLSDDAYDAKKAAPAEDEGDDRSEERKAADAGSGHQGR